MTTSAVGTEHNDESTATDTPGNALALPFAWEHGPQARPRSRRDRTFRFPSADDPRPRLRRLLAMSLYTAALGLLALAVTIRGLIAFVSGSAPGWYEPVFAVGGLVGVALVVAAFLSIHRYRLPYVLLALSAVPLITNLLISINGI